LAWARVRTKNQLKIFFNSLFVFEKGLIDSRKCAGLESTVDNRLQQIIEQWEFLVQKSSDKSLKLKEASRQQTFNAGVKDVEFWLGEVSVILFSCVYYHWNFLCCFLDRKSIS